MNEKKKNNVLTRFLTLEKKCIEQEPLLLTLEIIVVLLEIINSTLIILLPKYLLNSLNETNQRTFMFFLILFFGIKSLISCVIIYIEPFISKKKEHFNSVVLNEFLTKSKNTKLEKFDEAGFYNLYLLTFDKCCDIFQGIIDITMQIFKSLLTITVTILILSWVSPWIFICMCCFVLIQTFLSNRIKKLGYDFNKRIIEHNKQLNYIYRLFYIPEYMRDLRINNAFDFIFNKKNKEVQDVVNLTYASKRKIANISIISTLISFIEMILVNGYLGYMVYCGTIWIDMFITSQNSYSQLESAISSILDAFTKMYENDLYIKDYLQYMLNDSEIVSGDMQINSKDIQKVTFNNVYFRYPNTDVYALENVSFSINYGEHVLITGENGAGKTSIVKLLLRLYEPCSGNIKINDIDIRKYSVTSLRQSFSTLLQDSAIYAFSIRENLSLGMQIEKNDMENILTSIKLMNKVNSLKNKLDTPVSSQLDNEGVDFSAGERQKLILARNFLKGNQNYILDEPTSNLDAMMEKNILASIIKRKDITLILISHNLYYAEQMDKIIFMKGGRILEIGTKNELLGKKKGAFLQFYNVYNNKI